MQLLGRKILVTGGTSGLGFELTRQLNAAGATVIVCGRDETRLQIAADECGAIPFQCDLKDPAMRAGLTDFIHQEHGDLAVLVNNAAINRQVNLTKSSWTPELLSDEVDVNLTAPIDLTRRLLPVLLRQPDAAICFVTSGLARVPKQSAPVYCATKAGLAIFARALRYQLAGARVHVSEIVPALIKTPMLGDRGGRGVMQPADVASRMIMALERNEEEVRLGPTRFLYLLHRLMPGVAYKLLRNQ